MNLKNTSENVSIPWKTCITIGLIFGALLCFNPQLKSQISDLLLFLVFLKLSPLSFILFSVSIFVLMFALRNKNINRCWFVCAVGLLFNGFVGGYIGLAIYNFRINQVNDAIDFLMMAWVMYV